MMQVNIYTYQTIKGPGTKAGTCTYILETEVKGKVATLTKTESLEKTPQRMRSDNLRREQLHQTRS